MCAAAAIDRALFDRLDTILVTNKHDASRLVPILQQIQHQEGYLPPAALAYVAEGISVPVSRVYGVATFYAHFTLEPKGRHICRLCDGTACHVKNSRPILDALRSRFGIEEDAITSPDGAVTVETVSCLGACGLAPVLVIDDAVHGQVSPDAAVALVEEVLANENGIAEMGAKA